MRHTFLSEARKLTRIAGVLIGVALLALYFWQIFVTMPHLTFFSSDTPSYLQKLPLRGVVVYYIENLARIFNPNFYSVAVLQGILYGAASATLAYALYRATRSTLLGIAALIICLFKVSLDILTPDLASDSLFASVCLGLFATTLFILSKPSLAKVAIFIALSFAAATIRSIGEALLWALILVMASSLWAIRRRLLALLVVGCGLTYALSLAINVLNYGYAASKLLAALTLICAATFLADEHDSRASYPHEFAVATIQARQQYEDARTWSKKFEVVDDYFSSKTWTIAENTIYADNTDHNQCYGRLVSWGNAWLPAALQIIGRNPRGYAKLTLVKLVAGSRILSGYENFDLANTFSQGETTGELALVDQYIPYYRTQRLSGCAPPDLLGPLQQYDAAWRAGPHTLTADYARPLRELVGLVPNTTLNLFYIVESVIVGGFAVIAIWRRRISNRLLVLLVFVLPEWVYLLAVCVAGSPARRYLDVVSPGVYIALLTGIWVTIDTLAARRADTMRRADTE